MTTSDCQATTRRRRTPLRRQRRRKTPPVQRHPDAMIACDRHLRPCGALGLPRPPVRKNSHGAIMAQAAASSRQDLARAAVKASTATRKDERTTAWSAPWGATRRIERRGAPGRDDLIYRWRKCHTGCTRGGKKGVGKGGANGPAVTAQRSETTSPPSTC